MWIIFNKKNHKEFIKKRETNVKKTTKMKYWKDSVFTEEVKRNALSSNIDKKNIINRFDKNMCIWNEQRSSM